MIGHCDNCEKIKEVKVDEEFPQFQYCEHCYVIILTEIFGQLCN